MVCLGIQLYILSTKVVVVVIKYQEATEKQYVGHCMSESTSVKAQNV